MPTRITETGRCPASHRKLAARLQPGTTSGLYRCGNRLRASHTGTAPTAATIHRCSTQPRALSLNWTKSRGQLTRFRLGAKLGIRMGSDPHFLRWNRSSASGASPTERWAPIRAGTVSTSSMFRFACSAAGLYSKLSFTLPCAPERRSEKNAQRISWRSPACGLHPNS